MVAYTVRTSATNTYPRRSAVEGIKYDTGQSDYSQCPNVQHHITYAPPGLFTGNLWEQDPAHQFPFLCVKACACDQS